MNVNFEQVLVGADPEVLIKQGINFVSAHGLVRGDKARPEPVKNGSIQVDGMALEFNIDPAKNLEEFLHNIESVYSQLRAQVPEEFTFSDQATALFNFEYFNSRSPEELVLGCESDFNAYTGDENKSPDGRQPVRTAGGHVHLGWREWGFLDGEHKTNCEDVVKACDFFLGLPSVVFDDDVERRAMYGKAGCYRPKSYGVEYRTLSNAWIHSKELQTLVYNNAMLMFERRSDWEEMFKVDIQEIINNSDKEAAIACMQQFDIPYI